MGVAAPSPPSLAVLNMVSGGRKATLNCQERSELRSCVKVDVAVLGSPFLIVRTVSGGRKATLNSSSTILSRWHAVLIGAVFRSRTVWLTRWLTRSLLAFNSRRLAGRFFMSRPALLFLSSGLRLFIMPYCLCYIRYWH